MILLKSYINILLARIRTFSRRQINKDTTEKVVSATVTRNYVRCVYNQMVMITIQGTYNIDILVGMVNRMHIILWQCCCVEQEWKFVDFIIILNYNDAQYKWTCVPGAICFFSLNSNFCRKIKGAASNANRQWADALELHYARVYNVQTRPRSLGAVTV